MKIFINPGHMVGIDSGAVNRNLGVTEAAIVLDISNLVEKYLKQAGYEVMSLQSDNLNGESPSFKNVCATANDWGADAFVSIHCNAFNTEARGTETLCYSVNGEGGRLAKTIHNQLMPTLKTLDSTIPDRGIKERKELTVLRRTDMPAVLVEVAFIDNEADVKLLINKKDDIARAIARGVSDFYA